MPRIVRKDPGRRAGSAIAALALASIVASATQRDAIASSERAADDAHRSTTEPRTAAAAFVALVGARDSGDESGIQAAVNVLATFPRVEIRAVIERAALPGVGDETARAGLVVLERFGQADDLAFAAALLRAGSEEDLERAVLAVARRDRRALAVLEGLLRHVRTDVRVAFLRAVDGLGSLQAVVWIARCGEHSADVRGEALARLGRLAESLAHPAPEEALSLVHGVLGGIDGVGLRDAVIAAGRIEDGDSVPYLIALLSEGDPGLRADAAWSLQRITGLLLRERKERWEDWYASELEWWRERSQQAFAELESGDRGACTRALLEISSHHSSRDVLSLRVIPLLLDPVPEVARLAAQSLRVLQSKVACAALVAALERPEPEVAKEAWLALRAITRKDLPNDAALWRATRGT
jgi:hypothetical protein